MLTTTAASVFQSLLDEIHQSGLRKEERAIASPQDAKIQLQDGRTVLNFCANNYLGLANHPDIIAAAQEGITKYGFGLSSVRFICGTQTIHKELEAKISAFLGTEDTILYGSCFDANAGLFETLLDEECAVISDALNHASIIDGIRLCKAKRYRFAHSNMEELEQTLRATQSLKIRLIATDGVFSMDGDIATIGISAFAVDQLGDIVFLELPEVGDRVTKGETFGSVESVKAVEDMYCAVTGTVVERNETVLETPEQLADDPYGEGWLLKVRVEDASELDEALTAEEYRTQVEGA